MRTDKRMLFFNLDCTDFACTHDTRNDGGGQIDRYVDRIIDGGVTHFLCNTNAERTNYDSAAWEPFWTGYDPAGPDDQPFLAPIGEPGSAPVAAWRRLVGSMLALHRQGIDYPARVLARGRERGVAAWISLRMNDVHCQDNEAHPIHSDFWRGNPPLRRQGYSGYYAKALDYAQEAVRNHYLALIVETLERYDLDGIELDFMREPYLFSRDQEAAGRDILTAWLGKVRALVHAASKERGHAIQMGVRVPSRPAVAERFGLDPINWAQEGLIDVLVPTPRWASIEFDIPVVEWRSLLADTGVTLLGGLEILYRPWRNAAQHGVTPAQARGAAAQILGSGADGVYLFNYFPSGQPSGETWWSAEDYPQVLQSMTALGKLLCHPRSHAISCQDVNAPDGSETDRDQLPAKGEQLTLMLPTGPSPKSDWTAMLVLDVEKRADGKPEAPVVRVGHDNELARPESQGSVAVGCLRYAYKLPVKYLHDCESNRIVVHSADGPPIVVLALQVNLIPGCHS